MFIEALFTIARHGNNLCPPTDEWIKQDVTHTHTVEYYSAMEKNEIL